MGTKTDLASLNEYLFEQLDRLSNEDLSKEQLDTEISRAKALTNVADKVINNAKNVIEAQKLMCEYGNKNYTVLLPLIQTK